MLRVYKKILILTIVLYLICTAGLTAFADSSTLAPVSTTPIFDLKTSTSSKYNFIYKYLKDKNTLDNVFYDINILSAYISSHTQTKVESTSIENDNTINVSLPNQNIVLKYTYTKPDDYTITTSRVENQSYISNKTFRNISSSQNGGAVSISSQTQSTIKSDFLNNTTSNSNGGAIYNEGVADVDGVFIENNVSGTNASGGAIHNTGSLTLNADFIRNFGKGSDVKGGALSNSAETTDSIISELSGNFLGNYVLSSEKDAFGGAIYNYTDKNNIDTIIKSLNGSFTANQATSNSSNAYGGAIYNGGLYAQITSIDADFISNKTSAKLNAIGGAIYNNSTIDSIVADFISNSSVSTTGNAIGGAIYNNGKINSLKGLFISNITNGISVQGGAIANTGYISLLESSFVENKTSSGNGVAQGGAIYNTGVLDFQGSTVFSGNYSYTLNKDSFGGAIYNVGTITGTISGEFNENFVQSISGNVYGGSIYNTGFINEITAPFTSSSANGVNAYGGAIYNSNEIVSVKSDFYNNSVVATNTAQGGAICSSGTIQQLYSEFNENFVNSSKLAQGGAIYNFGDIYSFYSDDKSANFEKNYALSTSDNSEGGAIYNSGSILSLNKIDFSNNYSKSNNSNSFGGAIYNAGMIGTIVDNNFENNYTVAQKGIASGGAIYSSGSIKNIDTTFTNNYASGNSAQGGALYNDGIIISINSIFEENGVKATIGDAYGGAIYHSGILTNGIINSTFKNNYAISSSGSAYGGAIYAISDFTIKADNGITAFQGNYVQSGSGDKINQAIYVGDSSATITLRTTNDGTILFDDDINGVYGYKINISGDDTSSVVFNNTVYNAVITLNSTKLQFNENTFKGTNSLLITNSGIINLVDTEVKNYTISNLTSSENASYSIDIDSLNNTADTITIENVANGVIKIDNLNYLNPLTETTVVRILYTNSTDIKLALANEVDDLSRTISNTIYNTDVFIQETGASIIDNHSIKLLFGEELDGLKLLNEKITNYGEKRRFIFDSDSSNNYQVRSNLTSIGVTSAGELSIEGVIKSDIRSVINFSGATGFNLKNQTILNVSDTTLSNSSTAIILDNENATANLDNVMFIDNALAIQNLLGTVNLKNSVIEPNTFGESSNRVINNSIFVVENSVIKTDIENTGNIYLNGVDTIYNIVNTGTVRTANTTEFAGIFTNNQNLYLTSSVTFSSNLVNNSNGVVTTSDSDSTQGIFFNRIENEGKITLGSMNDYLTGAVINNGDITVEGQANLSSELTGSGTTTVKNNLTISSGGVFSEEQGLKIEYTNTVTVDGGTLTINTSNTSDNYDVINGVIVGKSGTLKIINSTITDRQLSIVDYSDITVELSNTLMNFSNNGISNTNLGKLVSAEDSQFMLDVDFETATIDTITLHSDSNAVINIVDLNGLSKDTIPMNYNVVFKVLNDDTNAVLYLDESDGGIVQKYKTTSDLSEFYNSSTDTYEVTSDDFIGTMGVGLDSAKKSIIIGNLTGYDVLNYLNIQSNIKRKFTVLSTGYKASKSIGVTASGSMEVVGDGTDKTLYVIDLGDTYSGFEINNTTNLTIKNVTIANALSNPTYQAGSVLNVLNSTSTIIIDNVLFKNNIARLSGGVIHNEGIITELVNSSFINNGVYSYDNSVLIYGGAIYSETDMTIKADKGVSEFDGNFIQTAIGEKSYEAVYISKNTSTLTLDSVNYGQIIFNDSINGVSGYKINVTGDETGSVYLNNKVYNANVELNNVTMNIGTDTFMNSDSTLNVKTGVLSTKDNVYSNYVIDTLTSSNNARYLLDFSLYVDEVTNTLKYNTDTITVSNNSSSGVIYLSDDNFDYLGLKDRTSELSQYFFNNRDSYVLIKILETNSNVTLDMSEYLQDYSVAYYDYNVKSSDFIGVIGIRKSGNDSIEAGVLSTIDAFVATNQYVYEGTRRFTLEDNYNLGDNDFGTTGGGKFEIIGNNKTVDFNGKDGFKTDSSYKTELVISDVTFTNSSSAIITTNNNSNTTVKINSSTFDDNAVAITNGGTLYLDTVLINGANETNQNEIINNGNLYLDGNNTISSNISGTGNIYLSSGLTDLSNSLIENNTFTMNAGSLKFGSNTFADSRLVINDGVLLTGDNEYVEYNIKQLNINNIFKISIDVDVNNKLFDKFVVGSGSTGTLLITEFTTFEMPDFEEYNEFKILDRVNPNDSIQLELSDELKKNPVANYTIERYFVNGHYEANDTDYICTIMLDINDTKDSLVVRAEKTGSVLSLFNQHKYKERIFNIISDEYVEDFDLGTTAEGKMVVNGNNHLLNMNNHSGFELSKQNTVLELNGVNIQNAKTVGNGSVVDATAYKKNEILVTDSSFENNTSDGLGGAIYTTSNFSISSINNDVVFANNLANNIPNDIYLNNSQNTALVLNLDAQNDTKIALKGGIDFNKSGLTINVNKSKLGGVVEIAGNLGTSDRKILNNFNLYGGTLSFIDDKVSDIYVKNLNLYNNTNLWIDIDVKNSTSDRFIIPEKVTLPSNKLMLSIDNLNMLSFFDNEEESTAIQLINTNQLTSRYFGFSGTDSDVAKYNYSGVDYFFILATEGYLVVSRDIPDYYLHPLVCAIKNMVANTYTMYSDNLLYNYGSTSKNPTQNKIQSNKLTIKGNNNSIIAGYLSENDKKLSGIALIGSSYYPAYKQEFWGYDVTFKGFENALMNRGGKITLSNVNFENNVSDADGNAILNESGTVLVNGTKKLYSHFYNNSSQGNGGAVYNSGTMTIQYVRFGNISEDGSSLGNIAQNGGAIYNSNILTVSNSEFISNDADKIGGAVYNDGTFKSTSNKFVSNTSSGNGGAVSSSSSFVDNSSEFTSNNAVNGGAIYLYQNANVSELGLTSSSFNGNFADDAGGAVYVDSGSATIKSSNFGLKEGNKADDGGAIYNKGVVNSTSNKFSNNSATNGGGIYNSNNLKDSSSSFNANSADNGGAVYNNGSAGFDKTNFVSNEAIDGGAIYNIGSTTLTCTNFTLNKATNGGAIYNVGDILLNKITIGNSKTKYNASNNAVYGGAIYNEGTLNSTSSNIYYNTATMFGGAIYNDIADSNKSLTLTTTNLSYNKTTNQNGFGGAIYNNVGQINLLGSTFSYNSSSSGGAIYNFGTLVVDNSGKTKSSFVGNYSSVGGAIYNKGSLNISNANFTSNTASEAGGALLLSTASTNSNFSANITNTTFSKNSSDFGGAIYGLGNLANSVKNYLTISNSSFTSNKSNKDGGAIYADTNSYIQIIDTDFKNNIAGRKGGAIFVNGGAEVSIIANTRNVVFSGNKAGGVYNGIYLNTYTDENGTLFKAILNLQTNNGKTISFNDYIAGTGVINVYGDTIFNKAVITKGSDIEVVSQNGTLTIYNENSFAGASLTLNGASALNITNGKVGVVSLKNLTLNNTANVSIDASLKSGKADKIQAETVTGEGRVVANSINIISNSKTPVDINVGKDSVISSVTAKRAESAEATYKLKSYYDENGMLRVVAYGQKAKPAAVAAPVAAQIGGYLAQINSYDQAFMNMDMNMLVPQSEREAVQDQNRHCEEQSDAAIQKNTTTTQDRDDISYNAKGLWNRPFATFERVNLNHGPKVNNIGYGNYFGGDADMKTLKNGWKRQFSAYIGYNGSVQDYQGQSIDQNGGTIGVTEVWYKNRFFTGLTVNAGANVAQASTDLGRENMPMFMAGIASKTGYNFEFKNGKFIVQPSLLISYSFIHSFAHDNGRGSHIGSSPLNAIQVAPGVKFIANLKNGWQPYLAVNMRWNIIDKTHFSLQDVTIPDMSIDPYVEYGVGLQRRWGERFTGFGQAMIRNGGRNGVMLSFGFKWLIGK